MKASGARLFEIATLAGKRSRLGVHYSSETDMWATPSDVFEELDQEFHFETDVCALPENAKCGRYFTPTDGGLAQKWTGSCWCNPPYGRDMWRWLQKAYDASLNGATVVVLIPSRTDTQWWHEWVMRGEIRFIKGRLKFGSGRSQAPFPSCVVIFRPQNEAASR